MKKIALVLGIILVMIGLLQGIRYFLHYNHLTPFGRGYVLGSFLLFLTGLILTFWGLKSSSQKLNSINAGKHPFKPF
jgi:hypothetical protein